MFASAARPGSIAGWTPADDSHDSVYTTIPSPAGSSSSHLALAPSPSSRAPRPVRNTVSRSLSIESCPDKSSEDCRAISRFKNATSLRRYKAKRSKDPNWAPRPPNAFILFRRDFVEYHKGEHLTTEKTTLSKRAGDAWRALTTDQQKRYFDLAKLEADEHLRRNPGYQFRPNKHSRSESRRHPATVSRREHVEELIRQTSSRRASISTVSDVPARSQCPSPGSAGSSSSPEPPGTPLSHGSASQLSGDSRSQSRSSSISRPPQVVCPIPLTPGLEHGLFDPAFQSNASLVSERPLLATTKRTVSYTEGVDYSPWEYLSFEDCYTESDDQSAQSLDSLQSPTTYLGDTNPEHLSPPEYGAPVSPCPTASQSRRLSPFCRSRCPNQSSCPPPTFRLLCRRPRARPTYPLRRALFSSAVVAPRLRP